MRAVTCYNLPIVEDRPDVVVAVEDLIERSALERALRSGCRVIAAEDGDDLYRICRRDLPDVVLLAAELGGDGPSVVRRLKADPSTRHVSICLVCERDDERIVPTDGADGRADEVLLRPVHPAEARVRVASICRARRLAQRAVESSGIDPLTSVFTRQQLLQRLRHEVTRAERYGRCLSVVLVDVDRLATISERAGTAYGDQVLREVARALVSRVRGVDLVARLGEHRFAVVLPETSLLVARPVAKRLIDAVRTIPVVTSDEKGSARALAVSAGIAGLPHPKAANVFDLLRCAREALSRAREIGDDTIELY